MNLNSRENIINVLDKVGQEIILGGWIFHRRDHGKVSFIDLRDGTGIIQAVITPGTKIEGNYNDCGLESVVSIRGLVKERPVHLVNTELMTGKIEVEALELEVISANKEALPLDISKDIDKVHLDTLLNYRPLTLRSPREQAIFKFSEKLAAGYREFLSKDGFVEIHTPKIIPSATEGGANVFRVDYFGRDVFLAQSPQFYKQMMVGVFEKVFEVGPVFRAEPHFTSRHLNEFTGLDAEIGFITDEKTIMKKLEEVIRFIFNKIQKETEQERKILNWVDPMIPDEGIPSITLKEAVKIINEKRGSKEDDLDLDSEGERILGAYFKEKYNSDFIFVTEYPVSIRPFYQMPSEKDPGVTKSFDILFRGLELGTGAQRIHNPEELIKSIEKHGMNPKDFEDYIGLFKYGMPPHGGWGLGLERFVKQWLELDNLRLASLFPRDVKRVSP